MSKISIIGAGNVGASLAQRLIERDIADVVLVDIVEGLPQGKALDLQQCAPVSGFEHRISGSNGYAQTAGSDVVVITSGIARKPGMSRDDLIRTNASIVTSVVTSVVDESPDCVLVMVTNPVDAMTYLAQRISAFPRQRVMGLSGVLDSARLATFIALETGSAVKDITCYALGEHGQNMVVFPRLISVNGRPLGEMLPPEAVQRIIRRAVNGGAEIVELLKTSSAFYAPSAAVARMVLSIMEDRDEVLPCAAILQGEYGLRDVAIGVPVELGRGGIRRVVELELTAEELQLLQSSAASVRKQIGAL